MNAARTLERKTSTPAKRLTYVQPVRLVFAQLHPPRYYPPRRLSIFLRRLNIRKIYYPYLIRFMNRQSILNHFFLFSFSFNNANTVYV